MKGHQMKTNEELAEEWRPVVGYEGHYMVSSHGNVKSLKFGEKILKPAIANTGYKSVSLLINAKAKNFRVHKLVADAFLKKPNGKDIINHKDGDKLNNTLSNLEWTDHYGNLKHAFELGLRKLKTHCKRGHEFTPENTVWMNKNTKRNCKKCRVMLIKEQSKPLHEKNRVNKKELFEALEIKDKEIDKLNESLSYVKNLHSTSWDYQRDCEKNLLIEIDKLREQLSKAHEVIRFCANSGNDEEGTLKISQDYLKQLEDKR